MKNSKDRGKPSASFIVGAVALLFLIIGYQAALFIRKASVARIIANHDRPDTVFIYDYYDGADTAVREAVGFSDADVAFAGMAAGLSDAEGASAGRAAGLRDGDGASAGRAAGLRRYSAAAKRGWTSPGPDGPPATYKKSNHSPEAVAIRRANTPRRYENFRFDPNTASVDDLMRLGFSQKQAQSIDNYRKKGGRFRRKSDFARSYVVDDSVYRRLEPFIFIPGIDLNKADSAAFETLPGIGKYFASKMVSYREELGGYSFPEQLMDIWHFDREKYDGLKDLVFVGNLEPYPLWTLPERELVRHPYIDAKAAHGIVIFRDNNQRSDWTVENLIKAGILDEERGGKLARCRIAAPSAVAP